MLLKRIVSVASTTVLLIASQTLKLNLAVPLAMSPVVAQPSDAAIAEAQQLLQQGLQQLETSQFQAGLYSFQKALTICREVEYLDCELVALINLGNVHLAIGEYAKGIEYSQQFLAMAQTIRVFFPSAIKPYEGAVLGNLSYAHLQLGDYSKAIEYSQQSLAIAREIKDSQVEGTVLSNLGLAYQYLGNYAKAIEYFQQRLALAREIKDHRGEGKGLGVLGQVYLALGDYSKAIEYSQQSLTIARELKDRQGEGRRLNDLGSAYASLGDYPKGIEYYQQWLLIAREIKDRGGEGKVLVNLGVAYLNLGDYPKAFEYSQQSLAIAREIKDRQGESGALGNLAIVHYYLGNYSKATEYFQQRLALAREIKYPEGEAAGLLGLGYIFYKLGNLKAAESNLIEGINVLESLRSGLDDANKVSIFDTQRVAYQILQQVLITQNKTDAALEIAERGRARAFVELLSQRLSLEQKDQSKITSPDINQIKQIARATNATLVQYSIIYDDFKDQEKQQVKESELYIWVIKPTGEVTFRKADLKPLGQQQNTSLKDLVTTTRESIGVDDRSIFVAEVQHAVNEDEKTKSLEQLHKLLIAPIADLLPTDPNQRVIFVPQGELFLVPFPALQDAQGKYLIEKHTILSAPSIQVLELTRQQLEKVKQAAAKDAIVVGNPTMPSVTPEIGEKPQQLASLPGAKREAEDIAPVLNTKALTGNEATKAAVLARLPQARVLHLATHGLFDDFQGLQSALALAPTSSDNGLLTAEEILNLKLNADLVVLSACNTGRGKITGDGVIGLSRSFITAGIPSVIVSLWAVPDAPTAELMTEFYTNLYQKKLDKAQALRQAMLKMMEKHRNNPRAWAAFTLIGEAE